MFTEAVKLMSEEVCKRRRRCTPPFTNLEVWTTSEPQLNQCASAAALAWNASEPDMRTHMLDRNPVRSRQESPEPDGRVLTTQTIPELFGRVPGPMECRAGHGPRQWGSRYWICWFWRTSGITESHFSYGTRMSYRKMATDGTGDVTII